MMRSRTAVSQIFLLVPVLLFATAQHAGYRKNAQIEADKSYEACFRLEPGEQIHYAFSSNADLRFNIHFHEGDQIKYPVPVRLTSSEKAVFTAEAHQSYCLMWKNPGTQAVEISVRYRKQGVDE